MTTLPDASFIFDPREDQSLRELVGQMNLAPNYEWMVACLQDRRSLARRCAAGRRRRLPQGRSQARHAPNHKDEP